MAGRHVVIVGAGPAGAALAYLLARRGIGVTLIERQTDFEREFRGEVLMPSGLDAFRQMGLEAALDKLPSHQVTGVDVYYGPRFQFRLDFTPAEVGAFGPKVVAQSAMLEMLAAEAARFPAFKLERGFTVRDVIRREARFTGVRGESGEGTREVLGDFVVGTDGRASIVRRRADLSAEGAPQAFDILWAKVPLPAFMDGTSARAFLGQGHLALAIPIYDKLLQVAWIIAKGSFGELKKQGMDEWIREMAAHVSPDLGAHLLEHLGRVTHPFLLDVVCDLLPRWTAPGLLLLGDAAHPMSPVGGQGLNIALRDALVAANHLIPVLESGAPDGALDEAARRVQEERMPEVREIQELQQIPPRIIFGNRARNRILLGFLLPLLVRTGIPRRLMGATFRKFALGVSDVRLAV